MTQLNTTELDFDRIKQNLISYFQRDNGTFKDWNFTGSGLNHLLDILAYNTHYNAMLAHTSLNESYLDSAEVRANVVSHAKSLGYTPSSTTAATATVNLIFNKTASAGNEFILTQGTKFTSVVGNKTHTFLVKDDHTAQSDGEQFTFNNIEIIQGIQRSQTFISNNSEGSRYPLDSTNIDTSAENLFAVSVFNSLTAEDSEPYAVFNSLAEVTDQSKIYFIGENSEGNYEIYFGNGVYGKTPTSSSRIVVTYIVSNGAEANGANNFVYAGTSTNVSINSVVTVESASGGAARESKSSIKFNAPLNFAAQDRAVTSSDYKALVKANISGLEDVLVWGGEVNDIVNYGTVYLCAKPNGSNILTETQRNAITEFLATKKMIGTKVEIVDATFTYLRFGITFAYDKNNTILNVGELESKIRSAIKRYNAQQLNNFNASYRHSKFLRELDNADLSILGTNSTVTAYKELDIVANENTNVEVDFKFSFAGSVDQTASMMTTAGTLREVTSSGNQDVILEDRRIEGSTDRRQIYSRATTTASDGSLIIYNSNVGFLYPETGKIEIQNFRAAANTKIRVEVTPRDFDVFTDKRNILQIDEPRSTVTGVTDRSAVSGEISTIDSGGAATTSAGSSGGGSY